jgi:hypothetical protein
MRYAVHIEDHDDANGGYFDIPDNATLGDILHEAADFLKDISGGISREEFSVGLRLCNTSKNDSPST